MTSECEQDDLLVSQCIFQIVARSVQCVAAVFSRRQALLKRDALRRAEEYVTMRLICVCDDSANLAAVIQAQEAVL